MNEMCETWLRTGEKSIFCFETGALVKLDTEKRRGDDDFVAELTRRAQGSVEIIRTWRTVGGKGRKKKEGQARGVFDGLNRALCYGGVMPTGLEWTPPDDEEKGA